MDQLDHFLNQEIFLAIPNKLGHHLVEEQILARPRKIWHAQLFSLPT